MNTSGVMGRLFQTQRVAIGSLTYASGQQSPIDIPRGLLLKSIKLRLSGTITFGSASITSLYSEQPLGLLQRIELSADGRKPFISTDGRSLFRKNQIDKGWVGELTQISALTVNTYAFTAFLTIDTGALNMTDFETSFLDTRLYDTLKLSITWAPYTAILVPGSSTVTVNTTTVDVLGEYTTEGFDNVLFNKVLITDELAVVATSNALRLPVPRNGLLRSILFRSDIDGNVSDSLINYITLRSENNVYHLDRAAWRTTQADNAVNYRLQTSTLGAPVSGYAYHELAEGYDIRTCLDTSALNTLDLVFDVTSSGTTRLIRVLYEFYEPAAR